MNSVNNQKHQLQLFIYFIGGILALNAVTKRKRVVPDVGVPLRADQLVEVVESRKLGFGEQRPVGPPFHLPQLLPHALLAELVQNVLNLQHSLQAPLLSLIALQLLPPRRLLHRLLDLNGEEKVQGEKKRVRHGEACVAKYDR